MNEWFYHTERGSLILSVVMERDMRWISSTAFSLILFSSILTGCLSNNEEGQNDDMEKVMRVAMSIMRMELIFAWTTEV